MSICDRGALTARHSAEHYTCSTQHMTSHGTQQLTTLPAQRHTTQHNAPQHSTALHSAAQHSTAQQSEARGERALWLAGLEAHEIKNMCGFGAPSRNAWVFLWSLRSPYGPRTVPPTVRPYGPL